jgi:ribonuclease P protein component
MKSTVTLKKNYEFHRLYSKGKSAVTPFLVVYARKTKRPGNRIGFTVSNKLGKAVKRNRVRRRLREIYRLHEERFVPGTELVAVARARAVTATYRQLETAFLSACGKLGLLTEMK